MFNKELVKSQITNTDLRSNFTPTHIQVCREYIKYLKKSVESLVFGVVKSVCLLKYISNRFKFKYDLFGFH